MHLNFVCRNFFVGLALGVWGAWVYVPSALAADSDASAVSMARPSPEELKLIEQSKVGQIQTIKGQVTIERGGTAYRAQKASPVTPSDVVETQSASEARLVMKDLAVLVLLEKTRFQVQQYQLRRAPTTPDLIRRMELVAGKVRVKVPKSSSEADSNAKAPNPGFEIRTAIATVGVRGTEFELSHTVNSTEVSVQEGQVEIWPENQPGNRLVVSAGQKAFVRKVGDQILKPQLAGQK